MPVLYKYMPFRRSFFDDPLLRLTPPSSLNDPFDSKPTQAGIEKKMEFFFSGGDYECSKEEYDDIRGSYEATLRGGLEAFGIISLTEDPYNLLMWSHYANEHKGMLVALSCDSSTFDYHCAFSSQCGITTKEPVKVVYSNRRPGIEMPDSAIYEYFEHGFHSHFAMVKGNDWIYEKEYRYLLRLAEADAAIVDAQSTDWLAQGDGASVIATHLYGSTYKIEASSPETRDSLPWVLAFAQGRGNISNVKLFKRIRNGSVVGVYFGCRVTDEEIADSISTVLKSPFFNSGLNFYRAFESQDRFEVNFERIPLKE